MTKWAVWVNEQYEQIFMNWKEITIRQIPRSCQEKEISDKSFAIKYTLEIHCFNIFSFYSIQTTPQRPLYVDLYFCWGKILLCVAYKVDVGRESGWNAPNIHFHFILAFSFSVVAFVNLKIKRTLNELFFLNIKSSLLCAQWLTLFYIFL